MRNQLLTAVLFTALLAPAAQALTIDNFEEGNFSVVDPIAAGTTIGEQSGLLTSNVTGAVRLVRVTASSGGAGTSATAALTTTGGDDGAVLSTTAEGTYQLVYDGLANGLSDGSAGLLDLDLTGYTSIDVTLSTPISGADIRITMWDATKSRSTSFQNVVNGVNSLAIDGGLLTLDLANITAILLAIQEVSPTTGMTITDISAVPEPTTALLLTLGLAGLAVSRKR